MKYGCIMYGLWSQYMLLVMLFHIGHIEKLLIIANFFGGKTRILALIARKV